MTPEQVLPLTLLVPLLGALLILATGRWPNLRESMTLITALTLFGLVASIAPVVLQDARPAYTWIETLPGLPIRFEVEPLGMLFALLASGLWIVNSIYSIGYMRGSRENNQTRFYTFFALSLASAIGVAFAGNMFTLFIFYEALTLSTYPLVVHHGDDEARRSGRLYLGILLSTSIGLQLVAILWTWSLAGTVDFVPGGILEGHIEGAAVGILLALYMFGIGKAALMPLHRWLPAAMVAPTPVSALLHAVAVVKAGVFTVLKVITYIFGIDFLTQTGANTWLVYVAGITVITASLVALSKDDLKARLAYSTVSQLSYIVMGGAMATAMGVIGGGMHMLMHGFGKITLFFCAGAIYVASKKKRVSQMDGLGRRMPVTMFAFFLGALCVTGIPPFGSFWSKWYLLSAAFESGYGFAVVVLIASTILNVAYLLPPVIRAFLRPANDGDDVGLREAPLPCLLALSLTAIGCLLLFFSAEPFSVLLGSIFGY